MAKKKKKYYVVWKGHQPGVFTSWGDCQAQVKGFQNAEYMSFNTLSEAKQAYKGKYSDYKGKKRKLESALTEKELRRIGHPIQDSYCVDAACSGNPGDLEYRCVHVGSRREIFRRGPYPGGTNNIGEFLALVHALATFKRKRVSKPIYSDSSVAIIWVRKKHCKTKLKQTRENSKLFDLIQRAESWLAENNYDNEILKWETLAWGEIPADYGRK